MTSPRDRPTALLTPDDLLDALDPEQRAVATTLGGPLCVLAGAGTGKTRAITHRIAYAVRAGIQQPGHVLAVTFTARAAGELRTRLRDLGAPGVQARTFHSAALRQLGYFWPQVTRTAVPQVADRKTPIVAEAANRLRLGLDRAAVRDLASEVEWAKVSLITPEGYQRNAGGRGHPGGLEPAVVARLLEVYEEVKGERGLIDFEDVLLLTAGLLEEDPRIAATVRDQYRHLVVDEYQDVSTLQQRLLRAWLGDSDDLCVVGDPSQTIYSFAGASPEHLLGFTRRYPGAAVVRLVRDYRSTPQVVGLANALLRRAGRAERSGGGPEPLRLEAQRPDGPPPTLTGYDDDVAEAAAIARRIRTLVDGGQRAAGIAVLHRINAQSEPLETALAEAGIPYLLRGGERFFARKEVRQAVDLLRAARVSGGRSDDALGDQTRDVLAAAGWSQQPPTGSGALRERWESLQALAVLADELAERDPAAGLAELVAELTERAAAQHAPTVEGVTLASLHAAKGLEWDVVFLAGLSEGLLPLAMADGWDEIEEERRLLYVGITRARTELHLSWARARTPGGRAGRSPSRFLDGLLGRQPAAPAREARQPDGPAGTRRGGPLRELPTTCRSCTNPLETAAERKIGRCSTCPPGYDEAVLTRLKDWRAEVAKQAKVPAYVVFTDATLIAIAETRPSDVAALAGVPGVGAVKLERYGADVLELTRHDG